MPSTSHRTGASLALSRTEPQFGTLVVDANDAAVELRLWSDAADQHLPPDGQWQLPPGKYTAMLRCAHNQGCHRGTSGHFRPSLRFRR